MAKHIIVELPLNRWNFGFISVWADKIPRPIWGPHAADGKSDDAAARAAGNPNRDPTKAYGDTPYGEYEGHLVFLDDSPEHRHSFGDPDDSGRIPAIALTPQAGDTEVWKRQLSENATAGHFVDMGLMIHAGALNGLGQLRPTHGCVRIFQTDRQGLIEALITPYLEGEGDKPIDCWQVTIQPTPSANETTSVTKPAYPPQAKAG